MTEDRPHYVRWTFRRETDSFGIGCALGVTAGAVFVVCWIIFFILVIAYS